MLYILIYNFFNFIFIVKISDKIFLNNNLFIIYKLLDLLLNTRFGIKKVISEN
jgi:hypothetical protein